MFLLCVYDLSAQTHNQSRYPKSVKLYTLTEIMNFSPKLKILFQTTFFLYVHFYVNAKAKTALLTFVPLRKKMTSAAELFLSDLKKL